MLFGVVMVGVSIVAPPDWKLWMWAAFAATWLAAVLLAVMRRGSAGEVVTVPTDSLVERFDLFTILVLGEVVSGVVIGLAGSDTVTTGIATAVFGMVLGFSFWWLYFDFVGGRKPVTNPRSFGAWVGGLLPISMAIVAAGAAVVSLVEFSGEPQTPRPTAWLLAGAVSLFLVSLVRVFLVLALGAAAG